MNHDRHASETPAYLGAASAATVGFLKWASSAQAELNAVLTLLGIFAAAIGIATTIFKIARGVYQWRKRHPRHRTKGRPDGIDPNAKVG